jgi:hypothetical protein
MKYILMMNGTKAHFSEYARWSKNDMEANVAFMRAFSKQPHTLLPGGQLERAFD